MKLTHLDLFSGIGGFAIASKWAGFETIQFVEKDVFCQKVLTKNFPNVPIHDDIKTFNFTDKVDLLTGGFPCQGFSIAGKRKGKNDDRYLWPEMYRIIKCSKPTWIVAENVSGIVAMELDNIVDDLEREGYESQSFIIPACAAFAPHRRDRVWIVANAMRLRCDRGINYWEARSIQENKKWNMAALHQEWAQFIPDTWTTFKAKGYFSLNYHASRIDDGLSNRVDRIRSLGNAIVPQVVYPILKLIYLMEKENHDMESFSVL